jgi:hypothetical protein
MLKDLLILLFLLWQEYIVEDLEGADLVPDLDPSHVTELRTLGLY